MKPDQTIEKKKVNLPSQQLTDLVSKFSALQEKISQSKLAVENLRDKEIKTGFFKSITGKTDAEISAQVKGIGENLVHTQEVVLFLVELSHVKNEVLRSFHNTLVTKLIELDREHEIIEGDLNISQKNEKSIVHQIKEQIEGRLAMEDSIDDNKDRIKNNHIIINENKQGIEKNKNYLSKIDKDLKNKSNIDNEQSEILEAQKHAINVLTQKLKEQKEGSGGDIKHLNKMVHIYGIISVAALLIAAAGFIL